MTTTDLLALPEDGIERWLIRGQLRTAAKGEDMTKRNRFHSRIMIRLGYLLEAWLERQRPPRGQILGGEAGIRLRSNPDTTVGVDVVYITAEVLARQTGESTLIDGVPTLVVEILSPNDTVEEINDKIDEYLAVGIPLVWIVHPHYKTVTVYRPGEQPELFNMKQSLSAEPHLPGFQVYVAEIFA